MNVLRPIAIKDQAAAGAAAAILKQAQDEQAERDAAKQAEIDEANKRADKAEALAAAARQKEADELAAQKKRDEDQAHRTSIKTKVKLAIMSCGADEETARKIIMAILADEIPNVELKF